MLNFPFFPDRASALASSVDALYFVWLALSGSVAFSIALAIVFFSVKYRKGSNANREMAPEAVQKKRNHWIELTWILTPLAIFLVMFAWAASLYYQHAAAPENAMEIYVVGKQWLWKLEHVGGQREINELHVPVGRPIKLVMTSQDVIHDFFMPVFRIKQDVLPGRYTTLWFTATKPGDYRVFCSQYCGTDHSRMVGHVVVMEPAAFASWLASGDVVGDVVGNFGGSVGRSGAQTMAARGAALFRQYGCSGCHGANASVHAPRLEGLFGKPVQLSDGSAVIADERYIHDSVMLPKKEITAGYAPIMPSFQGQIGEDELLDIVEYIKSLRTSPRAMQGEVVEKNGMKKSTMKEAR